jgi:hypothetical protein
LVGPDDRRDQATQQVWIRLLKRIGPAYRVVDRDQSDMCPHDHAVIIGLIDM